MFKILARLIAPIVVGAAAAIVPLAVRDVTAAGNNLIANPGVETSVNNLPSSWTNTKTGTNTSAFNYLNTGHSGSHSLQVNMTKRTSGQAEWVSSPVAVTASTKYTFTDWYESNVQSTVDVIVTKTGGTTSSFTVTEPASATWKQSTLSFTTPANASTLTVRQYVNRVGQVTTDDYDLEGPAPVAPTVKLTAPAANATVSGAQTITATATTTDPGGITAVQFAIDGVNSGAQDTTSPYSVSWDTTKVTNGNHTITATAAGKDGLGASVTETVNVQNVVVTAPTVSVTAPVANATVASTQTVTATATGGSSTVKNVQFTLDGANLGAADTTSPYSVSWDTTKVTNGNHTLSAIVTSATNVTATATNVVVNVNNPTAPAVSISSPAANATVSATQAITASASDAQGITSVQFKLDGVAIGSPVTAAPYAYNWDTTTASNGSHNLTAVATNKANLTTTSTPVTVTVSNTVVSSGNGPNIILNPGVETSASGTAPDSWLSSNWGTNTSTFSYLNTGHTGNHSLEVQTTAWTNGAANWYYADVPVTAGSTYEYSNWYQSNVNTEVDAEVTMTDGTVQYFYLGTVLAPESGTTWSQFSTTFTVPAGAKSMAVYQILAKVGYIITDDYSLHTYTPTPFARGIVTVDFDDGWADQFTNAVPALQANGNMTASFFIITDASITNPDPEYMTVANLKSLMSDGYEIGNHTETHPDLTTLTAAQVQTEMGGAQTAFQKALGITPTDFAYPFGAYNNSTIAIGQSVGFVSQRSVNSGFNSADNINFTQLKIEEVDADISPAQVVAWVNQAVAQHTWLILVYHEIDTTAPAGTGDDAYMTSPTNLWNEMAYIHSTGVAVETEAQAINEIKPQL